MSGFDHLAQHGDYMLARSLQTAGLTGRSFSKRFNYQAACDIASGMASHSVGDGPQLRVIIDEQGILIRGTNKPLMACSKAGPSQHMIKRA